MSGLSRREVLRIGVASGGGLLVGAVLGGCGRGPRNEPTASHAFGPFVTVRTDGAVVVTVPVPEIGQGVRTSLAMLVAEELAVPWSAIRVEQADASDDLGPHPRAAGSWSVRAYWTPLREAGAVARELLIGAAAARWDVPPATCVADQGMVRHEASGRAIGYGALAADAATRPAPAPVALREPATFRVIGQPTPNIDAAEIARGARTYGVDVRLPGLRHAVVLRAPVFGGTLVRCDPTAALQVPGVRQVVTIGPLGLREAPAVPSGVAVVADTTWAAMRGRDALAPVWDDGPHAEESTDRLHQVCRELLATPGVPYREAGRIGPALGRAARVVTADYELPLLAHVPMEPPACTVRIGVGRCEVWAPTQMPLPVRRAVAEVLGLPPEHVHLHVTAIGGGFGRRLDDDFVLEAVLVARAAGAPVQVMWTRSDDLQHGFFRPLSHHRLTGALDASGAVTAWSHRQVGTSRYAWRRNQHPGRSEFLAGVVPAALVTNSRLEYRVADFPFDRGPLRAPGNNSLVFVTESFIDELAVAAGADPLAFRLQLLGPDRLIPYDEDDPHFDTARMKRVLTTAADAARWGTPVAARTGRGIAGAFVFGTYVAHVAEVAADDATGLVQVRRVTSAIDCGRVVNPLGVRAQVEGAVVDGLSALFHGEITIAGGRVQQSSFADYPLLRIDACPSITTVMIQSDADPTGAGEPPYPPVAPAVVNAVFAACGVRIRRLPLRPADLLAARPGRAAS